jgi:hypothetical protein
MSDTETEMLAVIDAPHFYAGLVLRKGRVIEAADIVRYMRGWSRSRVRAYCQRKGWDVAIVWIKQTRNFNPRGVDFFPEQT